jgi:hypothetical protein
MAENFVSCEAFYGRNSAGPIYSGEWSDRFTQGSIDTQSAITTLALPFAPDQRTGYGYIPAVYGYISTNTPARAAIEAVSGYAYWKINGSWVDNGGIEPISAISTIGIGRQTASYQLRFAGAAQTAMDSLGGTATLSVEVKYRPERPFTGYWQDFATFGEFATTPTNTPRSQPNVSSMEGFLGRLIADKLGASGSRYACGTNRYAENASWAAIDCTGFVLVEASDIGVGPNQLPSDVALNSAERFRAHPNCFFRSVGEKNRGAAVRNVDTVSVNATDSDQPVGIYVNSSIITSCQWLLIVDGQPAIVKLYIDSDLDCYTPLQVWNRVLAPMCANSDSIRNVAEINGQVAMNRLAYLSYGRMLDRLGTPYTQDNTYPPG